jgi:peptidoglycan/xylan/chitin deacetylase (PgdA/CDA1 family)
MKRVLVPIIAVFAMLTMAAVAVPAAAAPPVRYRPVSNDCSAGNVTFTFDDGPGVDTPALLTALAGLNIKAVFFVLGTQVDGDSFGTQTVRDEVAQGHVVGNHTYDHLSFTGKSTGGPHLTDAQITDELEHTSTDLTNLGIPKPTLYRPPYGDIDAYTDNFARNLGYRLVMPWAIATYKGPHIVDSKDWTGIGGAQIASNVINGFTDANGYHPGIAADAIISMHDGEADTGQNTIDSLQTIVDSMNARHLCATSVIPADATGGVVSLPAPAFPVSGNLVQNYSLETVAAGTTEPACFQQGGANVASNTATWSLSSDAHTGNVAERVDVTHWTAGDRKLVLTQRGSQNTCIANLTAGQTVRTWVWYKGSWSGYGAPSDSTKVSIAVYYRTAQGVFFYWTASPLVPPTSTWSLASVQTPPLPSNATGVSFGMAIQGVGTLITDDYAMTVQ